MLKGKLLDQFIIEDLLDDLDDYYVDYADTSQSRITYSIYPTVRIGDFPRAPGSATRPMFHCLGIPPIPRGGRCPYAGSGCTYTRVLHQQLVKHWDIKSWATAFPGVVLDLSTAWKTVLRPKYSHLMPQDGEMSAATFIAKQIRDDFKVFGVEVDASRKIERSYQYDSPPGLLHLTVRNGSSDRTPHIHFNFDRRAIF